MGRVTDKAREDGVSWERARCLGAIECVDEFLVALGESERMDIAHRALDMVTGIVMGAPVSGLPITEKALHRMPTDTAPEPCEGFPGGNGEESTGDIIGVVPPGVTTA